MLNFKIEYFQDNYFLFIIYMVEVFLVMWYRKAQVQTGAAPAQQPNPAPAQQAQAPTQPAPVADQTAISGYQIQINNILAQTGKTYSEIITGLNNYKSSINSNLGIDEQTKVSASGLIDTALSALTTSAGQNLNQPYIPQTTSAPGTATENLDPTNPAARLVTPLSGSTLPQGSGGGYLGVDQIKQRTGPTMQSPAPGAPAGQQGAQPGQQPAAPSKTLYDALKAAGITNFIFEAMPGNTLPLDDRSFEMVKNNLDASKSLNPQAIATLKSLLANMGVYLTLDNNVMVFSKQKTEATPKPQSTFDTVPYKDEK